MKIKYIRDWLSGSSIVGDGNSHWVEIQAYDYFGNNLALNKTVTGSANIVNGGSRIVDGNTATDGYSYISSGYNPCWVMIDLQEIVDIEYIKLWHYYGDNRAYNLTKTEVSIDGITWIILHDSIIDGIYKENITGNIVSTKAIYGESILQIIAKYKQTLLNGYYRFYINEINSQYDVEIININGNLIIDEDINFGDNMPDTKMLIIIVNGSLFINNGVKVSCNTRKKGVLFFIDKELKNYGVITTTGLGSYCAGQDVFLLKNINSYEFIPAVGANGIEQYFVSGGVIQAGYDGKNGVGRETGGGATSGVMQWNPNSSYMGPSSGGTSYSGGASSGSINSTDGSTWGGWNPGTGARGLNIRDGGGSAIHEVWGRSGSFSTGGTGIIQGGYGAHNVGISKVLNDGVGTGGLLIIYAGILSNYGKIESNGIMGACYDLVYYQHPGTGGNAGYSGAGSSGGGSVNVFYGKLNSSGTITANGGELGDKTTFNIDISWINRVFGGKGGNGTVTIQQTSFVKFLLNNNNILYTIKDKYFKKITS